MLVLRNVTKEFEKDRETISALKDLDLTVERGEFVSLVGASGSGKSTLLFIIGALLGPTRGEVIFQDENIYAASPAHRAELRLHKIGFVFQTFNLIPYLSALDNVAVPAVLKMNSRKSAVDRAVNLLERFGLGARLDHKFSELSVGERQRVALCRSVINDPEIILADEPTGNLDPEMTREVMKLFSELNESGHTVIVVTHEEDVAAYAKRKLYLRYGRLENGTGH
jgi:putative ABC transport system ATP-binding protein